VPGRCTPRPSARWRFALQALGAGLLTAGVALVALVPLELHIYTYFAPGGRFGYPGFAYGSFMFANMAAQILGYLILATLLNPLGYGYLRLQRWVPVAAGALAQVWLVAGLPFLLATLAVFASSKNPSPAAGIAAAAPLALAYPALPLAVRWLHRRPGCLAALSGDSLAGQWIVERPPAALALGILYALLASVCLVLILLKGLFPAPGGWLTGLPAVGWLDSCVLGCGALALEALALKRRATWAGLVAVSLLGGAWIAALAGTSWRELLSILAFPAAEQQMLQGIPLAGWHLALLVSLPLALFLGAIVRAALCMPRPRPGAPANPLPEEYPAGKE